MEGSSNTYEKSLLDINPNLVAEVTRQSPRTEKFSVVFKRKRSEFGNPNLSQKVNELLSSEKNRQKIKPDSPVTVSNLNVEDLEHAGKARLKERQDFSEKLNESMTNSNESRIRVDTGSSTIQSQGNSVPRADITLKETNLLGKAVVRVDQPKPSQPEPKHQKLMRKSGIIQFKKEIAQERNRLMEDLNRKMIEEMRQKMNHKK